MDPAVIGHMRVGYFRIGVKKPDWDNKLLLKLKSVGPRSGGGITPCVQGAARQGQTRHNVFIPLFDEMLEKFKRGT